MKEAEWRKVRATAQSHEAHGEGPPPSQARGVVVTGVGRREQMAEKRPTPGAGGMS